MADSSSNDRAFAPLAGLRVIEFATEIAGPYAGKMLADAGAEVIKVESAEGDPFRRRGPVGETLADGAPDGALFRFLNAGKQSVTGAPGDPHVQALVDDADLVIESFVPARLDIDELRARNPAQVIVSVTPYGRATSWADRPANEFVVQAEGGSFGLRGDPEREPLQAGGRVSEWIEGAMVAVAALASVFRARRNGTGAYIDLALIDVVAATLNCFPELNAVAYGQTEVIGRRIEHPSVEPTLDGYVGFNTNTRPQLEAFLLLIERPDLLDDERVLTAVGRMSMADEFEAIVREWTSKRTTEEIVEAASPLRIPVAPVNDGQGVLDHPLFRARGFIGRSPDGSFEQPLAPYKIGGQRPQPPGPAPALGEHNATAVPRSAAGTAPAHPVAAPGGGSSLPLEGLRVLDATAWWAGPYATQLLAGLGADTIHLESVTRMDGARTTARPWHETWWERSPLFIGVNSNKRGITLTLDDETGQRVIRRLIEQVDVIVENYSPRVFEHFGLTWDEVHAINPQAILVRMPAFGITGPWRDNVGFAQTMEQMSGMAWVTGYADGEPRIPLGPCDPNAGVHAAFATLVAVEQRRRTGAGSQVEATMVETAINAMAELLVSSSAYGRSAVRNGNRGPDAAPQGTYRCAGTEQWLALSVEADEQWRALVEVLGSPGWAAGPRLATAAGRRQAADEIDRALSDWARGQDLAATVERLVTAGVPAGTVVDPRHYSSHPLLQERGFFQSVDHPVTGPMLLPGLPLGLPGAGGWHRRRSPLMGEHTAQVLTELLGMTPEEIQDLEAKGVTGTRPRGL